MKQRISPYRQGGRKVYCATWRDAVSGKRVSRSLGTRDAGEARAICAQLILLDMAAARPDSAPARLVSAEIFRLWFGVDRQGDGADQARLEDLQRELDAARRELEQERGYRDRYRALARSVEGKRVLALQNSPRLRDCQAAYFADVAKLARKGSAHKTWFKAFSAHLTPGKLLAEITPAEIAAFIDADAEGKGELIRRQKTRAMISRFFSWAAIAHQLPNPMEQVATTRQQAARDIQWHSLAEIEAALACLPNYWRALIGCMAYAGLSAHEVRGLRSADLIEIRGRHFVRVTPNDGRGLKNHKRQRNVEISTRLSPLLDVHRPGDAYLFEGPDGRGAWRADQLSRELSTRLPKGMDALSLRRSFGSLLIRSGKSAEEVAAAMGNSAEMVARHYGRILGGEVKIDF